MGNRVVILTGEVQTGKSKALHNWILKQQLDGKIIHGIVNPYITDQKWFINTEDNIKFRMNAEHNETNPIVVGNYKFSQKAFNKAQDILAQSLQIASNYLIIDEIGKLELKGDALEPIVSEVLNNWKRKKTFTLVIVVRSSLVKQVIERYSLPNPFIIQKEQLDEI